MNKSATELLTTTAGNPIADNQNALIAGPRGPLLLQDYQLHVPEGAFELKEHVVAIGLGLLPAYWYYWKRPASKELTGARTALTTP